MTAPMGVGQIATREPVPTEEAGPTCPKCGAEMECPTCQGESGELTPSQEGDVKAWFESNHGPTQMQRGAMR